MSTTAAADATSFTRRHAAMPMRTGHLRLADGLLMRVDIEMGYWVGRLYTPEMTVKTQMVGTDEQVHAWADKIAG